MIYFTTTTTTKIWFCCLCLRHPSYQRASFGHVLRLWKWLAPKKLYLSWNSKVDIWRSLEASKYLFHHDSSAVHNSSKQLYASLDQRTKKFCTQCDPCRSLLAEVHLLCFFPGKYPKQAGSLTFLKWSDFVEAVDEHWDVACNLFCLWRWVYSSDVKKSGLESYVFICSVFSCSNYFSCSTIFCFPNA